MKLVPTLLAILYLSLLGSALTFYPERMLQVHRKLQPWFHRDDDPAKEERQIRGAKFGGRLLLSAAAFLVIALALTAGAGKIEK